MKDTPKENKYQPPSNLKRPPSVFRNEKGELEEGYQEVEIWPGLSVVIAERLF